MAGSASPSETMSLVRRPRLLLARPRPTRGAHVRLATATWLVIASLTAGACLPTAVRPTPPPTPPPTPTPTAPPTPTPTPGPPTPTPGPTFRLYTVKRGDTLTSLARRFKTSARSLSYWNRDLHPSLDPESIRYNPDRLEVGWVLRVMPGHEYVPSPSDYETGIEESPTPSDQLYESPEPSASPSG